MVAAISLILLIPFSSFRRLTLNQRQLHSQSLGHHTDGRENIDEFLVGAGAVFLLGFVHSVHLLGRSGVVFALSTTHWR
jgi:hypothetical protein